MVMFEDKALRPEVCGGYMNSSIVLCMKGFLLKGKKKPKRKTSPMYVEGSFVPIKFQYTTSSLLFS